MNMNWSKFYNDRYRQKVDGKMERIRAFHNADNISFLLDMIRWGVIKDEFSILDIGSGWAIHLDLITEKYEVFAVKTDLSEVALRALKSGKLHGTVSETPLAVMNADHLPFANDSFDLVICSQVLEHVPNDYQVISECYRVLRPDGHLVLAVPNCLRDMYTLFHPLEKVFDRSGHIHEYCKETIINMLCENGLKVKVHRHHAFFTFWILALIERNAIGAKLQYLIAYLPIVEQIVERILTALLFWENIFLGTRLKGGLSIEFVAQKT